MNVFEIIEGVLALIGAVALLGMIFAYLILRRDEEEWAHLQRDRVVQNLKSGCGSN